MASTRGFLILGRFADEPVQCNAESRSRVFQLLFKLQPAKAFVCVLHRRTPFKDEREAPYQTRYSSVPVSPVAKTTESSWTKRSRSRITVVPSSSSSVSFVVTFLLFHAAMWRSSPEPKIPLMRPEQATRPTWPACSGVSGLPPITVGSGARIRLVCRYAGQVATRSSNSSRGRPLIVGAAGALVGTAYGSSHESASSGKVSYSRPSVVKR